MASNLRAEAVKIACYGRSKAYIIYNSETNIFEESIHINFDDKMSELVDSLSNLEIRAKPENIMY